MLVETILAGNNKQMAEEIFIDTEDFQRRINVAL